MKMLCILAVLIALILYAVIFTTKPKKKKIEKPPVMTEVEWVETGIVHNVDTSTLSTGPVYLTDKGALTSIEPEKKTPPIGKIVDVNRVKQFKVRMIDLIEKYKKAQVYLKEYKSADTCTYSPELRKKGIGIKKNITEVSRILSSEKSKLSGLKSKYKSEGSKMRSKRGISARIGWYYVEGSKTIRPISTLQGRDKHKRVKYVYSKDTRAKDAQAQILPLIKESQTKIAGQEAVIKNLKASMTALNTEYRKRITDKGNEIKRAYDKVKAIYQDETK